MDRIEAAASDLRNADVAVALTGAGVSVPSGVPPFRGEGGIWSEYDPDAFDVWRFRREPADFWADWLDLRTDLLDADLEPNAAHEALASLSTAGHLDAIVTQNVDGLHDAAFYEIGRGFSNNGRDVYESGEGTPDDGGTDAVVELHGNARRAVCRDCDRTTPAEGVRERAEAGELPPRCEACDGVLKPDAVLFGERLPSEALARSERLAAQCDVMVVAGSSLTVEPAASLPERAAAGGATLILVNLDETPLDSRADHAFHEDVTDVLPALRDAVVE